MGRFAGSSHRGSVLRGTITPRDEAPRLSIFTRQVPRKQSCACSAITDCDTSSYLLSRRPTVVAGTRFHDLKTSSCSISAPSSAARIAGHHWIRSRVGVTKRTWLRKLTTVLMSLARLCYDASWMSQVLFAFRLLSEC